MKEKLEELRICPLHGETIFHLYITGEKSRWRCAKCVYEAVKKRRERVKQKALDYKGGKCCICGYNKYVGALEFHHLDPNKKDFNISTKMHSKSWETIKEELNKCILVCSNCHRELHHAIKIGEIGPEDLEKYNINYEVQEVKKKEQVFYCCKCGINPVVKKGNRCVDCYNKDRQKVERPNREELKNLIRNNPFVVIGRMYDVADNSVRKWCKKYNLPYRAKDIKNYSDEEWDNL